MADALDRAKEILANRPTPYAPIDRFSAAQTVGDVVNQYNAPKVTGTSPSTAGVGQIMRNPQTGQILSGDDIVPAVTSKEDPTARIGDYVYSSGKYQLIPGSMTDLVQRNMIVEGGSSFYNTPQPLQSFLSGAVSGFGQSNITASAARALGASTALGMFNPLTMGFTIASGLSSLQDAQEKARDQWLNTKVNVYNPVSFYRDEDGKLKAKIDYKNLGKAGDLSSEQMRSLKDMDTKVEMGDDGHLKITVSPLLSKTNYYQELKNNILEAYPNLSKDSENLQETLDKIRDYVNGEKKRLEYDEATKSEYTSKFGRASDLAISMAGITQLAGNVNPDDLEDYKTYVYRDGKVEEITGKELLDHVKNMTKEERSQYIEKLVKEMGDDSKLTDSEKALVYAEYNAIYSASTNTDTFKHDDGTKFESPYKNMLERDTIATVLYNLPGAGGFSFSKLFGVNQQNLYDNEFVANASAVFGTAAQFGEYALLNKASSFITKHLPGVKQLRQGSFLGEGGTIAKIYQTAQQGTKALATASAKTMAVTTIEAMIMDGAITGAKALNAQYEDFLDWAADFSKEFALDFAVSSIMNFAQTANFLASTDIKQVVTIRDEYGNLRPAEATITDIDPDTGLPVSVMPKFEEGVTGVAAGTVYDGHTIFYNKSPEGQEMVVVDNNVYVGTVGKNGKTTYQPAQAQPNAMVAVVLDQTTRELAGMPEGSMVVSKVGEGGTAELMTTQQLESAVVSGKLARFFKGDVSQAKGFGATKVGKKITKGAAKVANKIIELEYNDQHLANVAALDANAKQPTTGLLKDVLNDSTNMAEHASEMIRQMNTSPQIAPLNQKYVEARWKLATYGKIAQRAAVALHWQERAPLIDQDMGEREFEGGALAHIRELNSDIFDKISPEALQAAIDFNQAAHNYVNGVKEYLKTQPYIEKAEIEALDSTDLSEGVGWLPLWPKKEGIGPIGDKYYTASNYAAISKGWNRSGEILPAKKYVPIAQSTDSWLTNIFGNAARYKYSEDMMKVFELEGMAGENYKGKPKTIREKQVSAISNRRALDNKFKEFMKEAEEAYEKVPTYDEYTDQQNEIMGRNGIPELLSDMDKKISDIKAGENPEIELNKYIDSIKEAAHQSMLDANKYNLDNFGIDMDVEMYYGSSFIPALEQVINMPEAEEPVTQLIVRSLNEVAPYTPRESMQVTMQEMAAQKFRDWASENMKVRKGANHIDGENYSRDDILDAYLAKMNGEADDTPIVGASAAAMNMGATKYHFNRVDKDGKMVTETIVAHDRFEKQLAEEFLKGVKGTQIKCQAGIIRRTLGTFSQAFQRKQTMRNPVAAISNYFRDAARGAVGMGQAVVPSTKYSTEVMKQLVGMMAEDDGWDAKSTQDLMDAFENCAPKGATYYASTRQGMTDFEKDFQRDYIRDHSRNKFTAGLKVFAFNLAKSPARIPTAIVDWAEQRHREQNAKAAFAMEVKRGYDQGLDKEQILKNARRESWFAGHEATANFSRKGQAIKILAQGAPYLGAEPASRSSLFWSFVNNPKGVSTSFATMLSCYLFLLADSLSNEERRKNYMRLSEYQRSNSIVIALGNDTMLSIPLDQTLGAMFQPFRQAIELMSNTDKVSLYQFLFGVLDNASTFDFSGFYEDDTFDFRRGIEKLMSGTAPTAITSAVETLTGYDMYYGSNYNITKEDMIKKYGKVPESAGDYTTTSSDSQTLRAVADFTGIPQWMLQRAVANYGAATGQYVLNLIDKLGGATEDKQGGKDMFNDLTHKFLGVSSNAAKSAFYDGVNQLEKEKEKVTLDLAGISLQMKTATGDDLYKLQDKYQKVKDAYATKVGDFVNQYLDIYKITGGLDRSKAMQIYYLFEFDDDLTTAQPGSVADYYNKELQDIQYDTMTSDAASVLDKYYDQSGSVYQTADGTWKVSAPYGEQAFFNTLYGRSKQHEVAVRNIAEDNKLPKLYQQYKDARTKAYNAKDYTTYDKLGLEYDQKLVDMLGEYVSKYGAEEVINNTPVLTYLSQMVFVPYNYVTTTNKRGTFHVSNLDHDASATDAFKKPFLKEMFGLSTKYYQKSSPDKADRTLTISGE